MKKTVFTLMAICIMTGAATAQSLPSLSSVFTALQKTIAPTSAFLSRKTKGDWVAIKEAIKTPQNVEFNLEWRNHRWHLVPDPNPPFSGLKIEIYPGQHVHLTLANLAVWGQDNGASFDVDGINGTIDGKPTHGIHVWLPTAVGQAVVDFTAPKEGIYSIYAAYSGASDGPIGQIVVLKP